MTWSTSFPTPLALDDGRVIATLADATAFMHTLPALHLRNGHWQSAAEFIMVAVDDPSALALEAAAGQFARALRAEGVMGFRGRR